MKKETLDKKVESSRRPKTDALYATILSVHRHSNLYEL